MPIPDPRGSKYDPTAVKRYLVGHIPQNAKHRMIVTEIRRPEPDACLHLVEGETVDLSNEEIRILLHGDNGPLIHKDLLTPAPDDAPAPRVTRTALERAADEAYAKCKEAEVKAAALGATKADKEEARRLAKEVTKAAAAVYAERAAAEKKDQPNPVDGAAASGPDGAPVVTP